MLTEFADCDRNERLAAFDILSREEPDEDEDDEADDEEVDDEDDSNSAGYSE